MLYLGFWKGSKAGNKNCVTPRKIDTGILVTNVGVIWDKKNPGDIKSSEEAGKARILMWMQRLMYC